MSSFSYKGILSILVSVFLVSGIMYASSTIISVQTQSIAQGDVIANGWFQEVNDSVLSQRTGINTLSWQIQTLSWQINGSIGSQWSNYPNNTSPTGIYYPVGNVGIGTLPENTVKLKISGNTITNGSIEFRNSAWLSGGAWFGLENWMDGKTRTHIWGFSDTDGIRRVWIYADQTYISGNMWIWIYNPSVKLDVNWAIKWTQLCIGNDCKASWDTSRIIENILVTVNDVNNGGGSPCSNSYNTPSWTLSCASRVCRQRGYVSGYAIEWDASSLGWAVWLTCMK